MFHEKPNSEPSNATRESVREELAKPRMTKSARIAQLNLGTVRIPPHPGATGPGTVTRIIPSPCSDDQQRDVRIENPLIDEHGDDVSPKKGAHAKVIVTAKEA
jgi:hypothetical protein